MNESDVVSVNMAKLMLTDVRNVMAMIEDRQMRLEGKLNSVVDGKLVSILLDPAVSSSTTAYTFKNNISFYFTALEYEILAK